MNSFEVYQSLNEGKVKKTALLEDKNAGIYPCYFIKRKDHLLIAPTVSDLIEYLGDLQLNRNFAPPEYFQKNFFLTNLKETVYPKLSQVMGMTKIFNNIQLPNAMYQSWETIDNRIYKLKPFQKISLEQDLINYNPSYTLSKTQLVNRTAEVITTYIHQVERQHPDKEHILLIGGRDSQLIGLVPKLNPKKWHIFTASPNTSIVKAFLKRSNIDFNHCIFVKNQNDKSFEFLKKKILGTDLYSDPRHQRWRRQLLSIQNKLSKNCFFWEGTAGASLFSYVHHFHNNPETYFERHLKHFGTFQASNHQFTKYLTGSPLLSPYHSPEFINKIYWHYNPFAFQEGDDLRPQIGEKLKNGHVWFSRKNPTPRPVNYSRFKNLNLLDLYINTILEKTNAYYNL